MKATPSKAVAGRMNPGAAVMANVLNPETESINLNTQLETPTLDPATELEQPLHESTSNPETAETLVSPALDADASTKPAAERMTTEDPSADAYAAAAPQIEKHAEHGPDSAEDFS